MISFQKFNSVTHRQQFNIKFEVPFKLEDPTYEMFECLLLGKTKELNIGHGAVEYITVRPLIMPGIVKVEPHVQDAVPTVDVLHSEVPSLVEMAVITSTYSPTIIAEANENMLISREETFGGIEKSGYETNHHQVCDFDY